MLQSSTILPQQLLTLSDLDDVNILSEQPRQQGLLPCHVRPSGCRLTTAGKVSTPWCC